MTASSFDTLAYARKLREAGFTEQQAETQAEALRAVVEENLATKQDIANVQRDLKEMETTLRHELKDVETTLRHELKEMESRVVLRLGALIVAGVGVLAVLMRIL